MSVDNGEVFALARAHVLRQLQISGFKAIRESGPIKLGPFNLLIGRNGSGKSSLIEALEWLQKARVAGLAEATQPFASFEQLLNRRSTDEQISFKLTHGEGAREVTYSLRVMAQDDAPAVATERCSEGKSEPPRLTITSKPVQTTGGIRTRRQIVGANRILDRDMLALAFVKDTKAKGAERLSEFIRNAVFLRLSPTAMAGGGPLRPSTRGPLLDVEGRELEALLNRLDTSQRQWVVEQIAEVLEGFKDIEVVRYGETQGYYQALERMRQAKGTKIFPIPSWLLSEGTRRITAFFALLAVRPRPSLIAIEEIENGLDPWTLRSVVQALREASTDGVQIILTTHSPFLLDHVQPDEVLHARRVVGDSVYEPMTSFDEVVQYRRVITPGAMYVSGYMRDAEIEDEDA